MGPLLDNLELALTLWVLQGGGTGAAPHVIWDQVGTGAERKAALLIFLS